MGDVIHCENLYNEESGKCYNFAKYHSVCRTFGVCKRVVSIMSNSKGLKSKPEVDLTCISGHIGYCFSYIFVWQ